ncbi:MAG TPA: spermidine/putrescine ABC transporter substrate-binding protein [Actinomycetota bacterium]|nr:spermidine/putrescine ABC transporter substrate-binding protein [Actinomycetota bacterium]
MGDDRRWSRVPARRLTRRQFLVGTGASLLVACARGIQPQGPTPTPTGPSPTPASPSPSPTLSDILNFANWPFYIDKKTLRDFRKQYGVNVNYIEEINDNVEYFAKIREPLSRRQSIERDIIVLTDWMASRLIKLGWLAELDKDNIPNWTNLVDTLENPSFDPGRRFSLPWQSGFTGIGYNPKLTGRKLTSVNDIFDPAFKGHVTMLTEMRDTLGLVLLGMGVAPEEATLEDAEAAVERIKEAVETGQIRRFTGNDYGPDLVRGDAWVSFAWSGDVVQLKQDNPDLEWLFPEEGFMFWSDNMLIPITAEHKFTAETFMNFVYDPKIAAQIAAFVQFVSPVEGVKEELTKIDPALAENPLIVPDPETLARAHIFRPLDPEEEQQFEQLFQSVVRA